MGRLKGISSVVLSVSLAFFAMGGLATLLLNRPSSGWKVLNVATGSMRPNMPPGSLVFVHRVPESSLKVGDVITYINPKNSKETITHRITQKTIIGGVAPGFVTKGDANPSPDAPIVAGIVVGKRVGHVPYLGKIFSWTRTWVGITVLIYLPALLIIIEEIKRLSKYYKEQAPYRLPSFERRLQAATTHRHSHIGIGVGVLLISLVVSLMAAHTVTAVGGPQQSNTVALAPNTLSVATGGGGGGGNTNCSNHTNVNVHNSSSQTAGSGNATNSNNTNGGSATSGSASNSNSNSTTITITNGC